MLDATLFKIHYYSPNLIIEDLGTDFCQPVSSMNIDKNLIIVTVRPNKLNKLAYLNNDVGYPIDSKIVTTLEPSKIKLIMDNNRIKAIGHIKLNDSPLELKIAPLDFDYYILHKVKSLMKMAKIKARIKIVRNRKQLPLNTILLNMVKSESLSNILAPALKVSDNLVLDSLYLKIINTQSKEEIKDWNDGNEIIKSLIRQYFNVDTANAMFVDGSGLSRYNRIQPKKFFAILKQGYAVDGFVAALASPGEPNSTLAKRTSLLRYIKAKTGNMSGISCLCGYSLSNHPKAFMIVANSFAPPNSVIFPVLDNFVNRYCEK